MAETRGEREPRYPELMLLIAAIAIYAAGNIAGWLHPTMLSQAIARFGLSRAEGGLTLSVETLALALTSIAIAIFLKGVGCRALAISGAIVAICGHLLSWAAGSYFLLLAARVSNGIGIGIIIACANAAAARLRNVERGYAYLNIANTLYGTLINVSLAWVLPGTGEGARIYLFAAGWCAIIMPLFLLLPRFTYGGSTRKGNVLDAASSGWQGLGLVLMTFAFCIGSASIWTNAVEIAKAIGIGRPQVATMLGQAGASGLIGSAIVVLIGGRFGRIGPIFIVMVLTMITNAVITRTDSQTVFQLCIIANVVGLYFLLPMLLAFGAKLDSSGRISGAMSGVCLGATAVGPTLSGAIADGYGLAAICWLVLASYGTALLLLVVLGLTFRASKAEPSPIEGSDGTRAFS